MSRGAALLLLALAWPARAQGAPAPPVVSGVSAVAASTGAVISWTTDLESDSEVDYGLTAQYGNTAFLNRPPATGHEVILSGLTPGTAYHYRVKSRGDGGALGVSGDAVFTTALAGPAPIPAFAAGSQTLPLVLIMTPPNGAVVSGTTTVSANASAGAGVQSVQFLLDGQDLAPPLAAGPYTLTWDTSASGDGVHALAAVARDAAGRSATSPIVRVTADNVPPSIAEVSAAAPSADGAYIRWTTSEPADSQVEYGMTMEYGQATPLYSSRVLERGVALTGLANEALYHYRVKSRDAAGQAAVSPDFVFATGESAPAAAGAAAGAAPAEAAPAKAPQRFLTPALADGINDEAVFGPDAREVSIVDSRGRRIFHESTDGPPIVWKGRDSSGGIVPSGVYIAIIVTRDSRRVYQSFAVAK